MERSSRQKLFYPLILMAALFTASLFPKGNHAGLMTGHAYAADSAQNESAELVVQNPHAGTILSLAVSHDNKIVASAGDDGMVKLWDVETGRLLRDLMHNQYFVHSVAFSPNRA